MTALPSFVELMATLGLDNRPDLQDSSLHHSRSSSYSSTSSALSSTVSTPPQHPLFSTDSPAIVISRQHSPHPMDWELDRRRYRSRYSPYAPPISHTRRGSMPTIMSEEDLDHPSRALSSSPCHSVPVRTVKHRASALGLTTTKSRRPEKLNLVESDRMANMPISSFVRRKTPQSSPISPTFPHRRRRPASPSHTLVIPTLPPFIFPRMDPLHNGSTSSDTEDDEMNSSLDSSYHLEPLPCPQSPLSLTPCAGDSSLSRRSSPSLDQSLTPIA